MPKIYKKLEHLLDTYQDTVKLAFLSSYIPRRCGIATFTKDLTTAINDLNPYSLVDILAMDTSGGTLDYPHEVVKYIRRDERSDYGKAAAYLNSSPHEAVCLQHEYGLFGGGEHGPYILDLIEQLEKPLVSTFHTVLHSPTADQREMLTRVANASSAVVVMLPQGREQLEKQYGVDPSKVVVIHHGVADRPRATKKSKQALGWQGKRILLVTGLLNPNKGIEYIVEALPGIVADYPETLLVVVGQTHPEIIAQEGEQYRDSLRERAAALGVAANLTFVDRYLPLDELLTYYDAADIYLTPHLDPQQTSSGTLAYALGMGKACVSTPYTYAKEMLRENRGVLVEFRNAEAVTTAVNAIFADPQYQVELEQNAYALGRTMSWPRVAGRYLLLFRLLTKDYDANLMAPAS